MVDLNEFTGRDALHASLLRKRARAQEKLDAHIAKAQEKIAPLQSQIEKFDALLQVLDEGHAGKTETTVHLPVGSKIIDSDGHVTHIALTSNRGDGEILESHSVEKNEESTDVPPYLKDKIPVA